MATIPPMKWAQRKESVFITMMVTEIKDPKVDVNATQLTFSGKNENKEYSVTLNFYKEINPEKSKWSCTPRCVQFHLQKDSDETWPYLLKDKNQYKNLLQIDWDLWADSDDEDESGNPAGNFQLPPNFQELMSKYNSGADMDMPDVHDHDHCNCGECDSCDDSDHEEGSSSDSDEMPPLEEA